MNALEEQIIRAVARERVTRVTVAMARRLIARREALADKPAPAAVQHHARVRRSEEIRAEDVKAETWSACLHRTRVDHRAREACESCHHEKPLEPHHLEMGAGGRRDAPEAVMALCADCHRLDPTSAHRAPRSFAIRIVIPWAQAHGYPLPSRKEYRHE